MIFVGIISISVTGLSQTKSETEEWITRYFEDYFFNAAGTKEEKLFFGEGKMYNTEIAPLKYGSNVTFYNSIELRDVKILKAKYGIAHDLKYFSIELRCSEGTECIGYRSKRNEQEEHYESGFYLTFNNDFVIGEMENRMIKALQHIIKLNGGNAIIKQEVF